MNTIFLVAVAAMLCIRVHAQPTDDEDLVEGSGAVGDNATVAANSTGAPHVQTTTGVDFGWEWRTVEWNMPSTSGSSLSSYDVGAIILLAVTGVALVVMIALWCEDRRTRYGRYDVASASEDVELN